MLVVMLFLLAGLLVTYSRPSLLAVLVSLLLFGLIKKDKLILTFFALILVVSPFILPRSFKDWAREMNYNPLRIMCNDDRIAVYRNTLNMIRSHPIIGVGSNTFMKNYKSFKENPEYRNIITSDYMYAHNNFLHMAAEIGLAGLGIFVWLLYKLFRSLIDIYKTTKDDYLKILVLSSVVSLAAFLVNGLTESSLYYSRVAVLFWYVAGLGLSLKKVYL